MTLFKNHPKPQNLNLHTFRKLYLRKLNKLIFESYLSEFKSFGSYFRCIQIRIVSDKMVLAVSSSAA